MHNGGREVLMLIGTDFSLRDKFSAAVNVNRGHCGH